MLEEQIVSLSKQIEQMKQEVLKLITDLVKEDMTLIIVSHEEEFVKKVADKIIEIKNSELNIR